MTYILYIFAFMGQAEVAGGVTGGAGVVATAGWLVRRFFKRRDERRKNQEAREAARDAKIDRLSECTQKIAVSVEVIKTRLDAGDSRMERMEAGQDNTQRDVRQIRADVTTIKRKTGQQ